MNLAYNEQDKKEMANNEALLDTLVLLMGDVFPQTRIYASVALFTLACVASNTKNLALHRGGSIVESLCIIMLQDTLDEARDIAAEALFNLARNSSTIITLSIYQIATHCSIALLGQLLGMQVQTLRTLPQKLWSASRLQSNILR
jgi:hypothetical protein